LLALHQLQVDDAFPVVGQSRPDPLDVIKGKDDDAASAAADSDQLELLGGRGSALSLGALGAQAVLCDF
jgi:hypothetical protein